jgi:Protein of unknown function (DUF4238)
MAHLTNNHYVWKHYLEAWAAPKFFCYRLSERKLFGSQPKVVANERDFYRTQRLSDADLRYLESLIERAPLESTRESNRGFVRMFQTTFALRDFIDRTDLPPDQREKVASELSEIERTMGEKYHSGLEDDGIGYLDELKSGSSSFYENDEDCAKFILSSQPIFPDAEGAESRPYRRPAGPRSGQNGTDRSAHLRFQRRDGSFRVSQGSPDRVA